MTIQSHRDQTDRMKIRSSSGPLALPVARSACEEVGERSFGHPKTEFGAATTQKRDLSKQC